MQAWSVSVSGEVLLHMMDFVDKLRRQSGAANEADSGLRFQSPECIGRILVGKRAHQEEAGRAGRGWTWSRNGS